MSSDGKKQDKLDKRAAALRENLRKRKEAAKSRAGAAKNKDKRSS